MLQTWPSHNGAHTHNGTHKHALTTADMTHPSFTRPPVPYKLPGQHTNPHSCAAAVDAVAAVLDNAVKPVLLAGAAGGMGGAGWLPDSLAAVAVAQTRVLDRRGRAAARTSKPHLHRHQRHAAQHRCSEPHETVSIPHL